MVAYTTNKGYPQPTVAGDANVWGTYLNQGLGILDTNMGGQAFVNVAGGVDVTATAADAQNLIQSLSGVITANISYLLPNVGSFYIINNATTGAFTVTIKTVSGGSVGPVIPQGTQLAVYSRGGNVWIIDGGTSAGTINARIFHGALTIATGGVAVLSGGAAIVGNSSITGTFTTSGALSVLSGGAAVVGNSSITGSLTVSTSIAATGHVTGDNVGRGANVIMSGNQAIPDSVTTILTWGSAVIDDAGCWSGGTPTALFVPAGYSRVVVSAGVQWETSSAGIRSITIVKNGAAVSGSASSGVNPVSAVPTAMNVTTALLAVTPGDYFQVFVIQNSGGVVNVNAVAQTWFCMQLLR